MPFLLFVLWWQQRRILEPKTMEPVEFGTKKPLFCLWFQLRKTTLSPVMESDSARNQK